MPRTIRRCSRDDRGSSALELAVIAPAVIFLIFSIIQFALWFYGRNVALHAAREGVAALRIVNVDATGFDATVAEGRAEVAARGRAIALGQEQLIGPVADAHYLTGLTRVQVRVSGKVVSLVPGLDLTVSQTVTAEVERFEPDFAGG